MKALLLVDGKGKAKDGKKSKKQQEQKIRNKSLSQSLPANATPTLRQKIQSHQPESSLLGKRGKSSSAAVESASILGESLKSSGVSIGESFKEVAKAMTAAAPRDENNPAVVGASKAADLRKEAFKELENEKYGAWMNDATKAKQVFKALREDPQNVEDFLNVSEKQRALLLDMFCDI